MTRRSRSSNSRRPAKNKKFQYRGRDQSAIEKRANQSAFDNGPSMFKDDLPVWRPNDGTNTIRILPPTWDEAEHFGIDIYVHYQVGADKQSFLALNENLGEDDPVYEERLKAEAEGDTKYASNLKAKKRVAYYIIDRDDEDKGVQVWPASWTIDKDINAICVHKRSGEIYQIDDPENGYDISFEKTGKGLKTEYKGFQIDRRESDLGDDEWLDFAVENPLPEMLNYMTFEEQDKIFAGGTALKARSDSEDDEKSSRGKTRSRRGREDDEDKNSRSEDDYDYDEVLAMDFPDLEDILDAEELEIDPDDYEDDEAEALAADILDELGIEKPKPKRGRGRGRDRDFSAKSSRRGRGKDDDDDNERLGKMRGRRRGRR